MKSVTKNEIDLTESAKRPLSNDNGSRFTALFHCMSEPAFVIDHALVMVEINRAFKDIFEVQPKDIWGKHCADILKYRTEPGNKVEEALSNGKPFHDLKTSLKINGEIKEVSLNGDTITDSSGKVSGKIIVISDGFTVNQALRHRRSLLTEKAILIRELTHRVKSNFQIVSSLINLQIDSIENSMAKNAFIDNRNRIRAMALVHEKLYQSQDLSKIDFATFTRSLVKNLVVTFGFDSDSISLNIDVQDIHLGLEQAIPCGLIVNELLSNALKHAFTDIASQKCEIEVRLRANANDYIELSVKDNGVGMPRSLDFQNTDSLGLFLVKILAIDQLKGMVELNSKSGTMFMIRFRRGVE